MAPFPATKGVDLVIQAMPKVLPRLPKAEFHIYGSARSSRISSGLPGTLALRRRCASMMESHSTKSSGSLADADVGVVAKRADSFGNLAYSTKNPRIHVAGNSGRPCAH